MVSELVKVTINAQEYEVPKGARLIDMIREKGYGIPAFCYYADLALQASCRMCLVRIEKMPKLQTSCTITCTDGMIVTTESEEIEKARRSMSEFLLANHPLDCPVCDRGGECELQEVIFDWGGLEERFTENKNAYPEKYLSPIVANDQQRCILCKRCTRVCDEWMGEDAIEAGNRGVNTVIGTYDGWINCSQCGNCIEVCPTGTLLDGTYRHNARPWELDQTVTTCTYCSDGCQMSVGSRGGDVMRVVARYRYVEGHNGEFLCIKGRFAHNFVNSQERIKTPLIRYKKGGRLIPATWDDALAFVAKRLSEIKTANGANTIGVVGSPRLTNESLFTLRRFATEVIGTNNYAVADTYNLKPLFDNLTAPLATHREIRHAKAILLIGGEPEEWQPFTGKQIRQAVRNNDAKLAVVNHVPIRLARRAVEFLHVNDNSYDAFALALLDSTNDSLAASKLGIQSAEIARVRTILTESDGDIVIAFGEHLSREAQSLIAGRLPALFANENRRVLLHPLPYYNNSVGAVDMGMVNGAPASIEALLDGAGTSINALYSVGSLLMKHIAGRESKLQNLDFVVVQELFETELTKYADVVLPAASFAEMDGTYTNNDGLVQRVRAAIQPVHQSRPDWMILSALAADFGVDFRYNHAATAVFKAIADAIPAYAGLRYPSLKNENDPKQVKHEIHGQRDVSAQLGVVRQRVAAMSETPNKVMEQPNVGHELHKPGTLTGKTPEFAYLAAGNKKPETLRVSPLYQINGRNANGNGSVNDHSPAAAAAIFDREAGAGAQPFQ